jgi:LysM repeat protein
MDSTDDVEVVENNFDQLVERGGTKKPITFKSALYVTLGLHVAAIAGIAFFSMQKKAAAAEAAEDKKLLTEPMPVYVGVEEPTPTPSPTPSPTPKKESPKQEWPKASTSQLVKTFPKTNSFYTKEYVIKSGDTFYGIVRKYKLNPERLKKINNITNENKLKVGQTLKLM